MNGFDKRKETFYHLRNQAEVICLQETHSTPKTEGEWRLQWGDGEVYLSHGASNSRGVSTYIKKGKGIEVQDVITDVYGRYLITVLKVDNVVFNLTNVYAPNNDNPQFFSELFKLTENLPGYRLLVGDFNVALDPEKDRSTKTFNNPHATTLINEYIDENFLQDVWHTRHPDRRFYSWKRNKPTKIGSHIDYILTDAAISLWHQSITMRSGYKTDHCMVLTDIQINEVKRGPGLWRLNTRHLHNRLFLETINQELDKQMLIIKEQGLDPAQAWEHIKLCLITQAKIFSSKFASEKNMIQNQLEDNIAKLNNVESLTSADQIVLERTELDLQEIKRQKVQGAIFWSRVKWFNEGEQNTKYFFGLEKLRSGSKNITVLIDDDGKEIKESKGILETMRKLYETLYTSDPSIKFDEINSDNLKLNNEQANSLEGLLSSSELSAALSSLNKDKAPATDGFPAELYKVFWGKIENPITRCSKLCLSYWRITCLCITRCYQPSPKKE